MTDFTDSLITNLGVYSSSPVMTSVNMVQLGEKLRQARISALTSLSQALSKNINYSVNTAIPTDTATDTTVNATLPLPATEKASGQLELYVLEGRNLTIADASKSDTYCIVHYEKNVTSTLDRMDDVILPNAPFVLKPNTDGGAFKAFEIMMRASSPKWMHRVKFDVMSGNKKISLFVYDRGNKLSNGQDRFLGMSSIVLNLVNQKTVELIFPLVGRPNDDQEVTGNVRLQVTYSASRKTYLKPKHFRIIRLIGQGSVGQVYEVVKRDSGRTYAMKVLSKRLLLAENQVNAAINERNVLAQSLTDPFIVNLKYSFQTVHSLFLVMDYFPGGELFDFLGCERCLSEKQCQLFAAEIVCALDNIHSRNIVFRNLRSESILLDAHGHLALTDFGLCKQLANDQDTIQGVVPAGITQEYLAPEMVLQQPYGKPVDWWSLGILMFELLTGSPPFQSVNEIELFRQILYGPIKFTAAGSCISQEAKDFVYQLLRRNPTKRLGSRSGVSQIKAHPFFNGINWDIVYKKQIHLPFTPDVKEQLQEEDLAVAAAAAAPTPRNETAKYHLLLVSEQPKFKGFSYNHEDHSILKGVHSLGVHPDDEDPEVDFWFRQ